MLRQLVALAASCVVLIGPQIVLLMLLNFRDRRQDRILDTIARDLSRMPGAVGCRIHCALFWPSSVVELHMWTCQPHEMWGTSLRVLERLPPGVRVLVEGPLSDQLVVSIGLVSRGRARPGPHGRAMPLDGANAAPAADGLGPRRAALAPAKAWWLGGADASSTGQDDGHISV